MALVSPGVEVKVVDESFYTPAEPGTVPLIIVASSANKSNPAGDGIAPGTLKANAGQVYLMTSQKDLVDTFGDPVFKTDVNNNPVHAGEQNEYGLQAAYSYLGVSNRAFVVRADIDLSQLNASATPPAGNPKNGTYWLNTQSTNWGIFEWNAASIASGGQKFINKEPIIITDVTKIDALTEGPSAAVGKIGSYAIVAIDVDPDTPALTDTHPMSLWYKNTLGNWVKVGSPDWLDSFVNSTGEGLATVALGAAGSGYSQGLTATVSAPTLAGGVNATVSVAVNPVTGAITGYTVTNAGSGYTSPPTVTLVKPTTVNRLATGANGGTTLTLTTTTGLFVGMQVSGSADLGAGPVLIDSVDSSTQITVSVPHSNNVSATLTFTDIGSLGVPGVRTITNIQPLLAIQPHTQVPQWKSSALDAPTGSVWIKTTEPNLGARWRTSRYNETTDLFDSVPAPLYQNSLKALFALDKVGGGQNLPVGSLYVKYNYNEVTPTEVDFKIYRRKSAAPTQIKTSKILSTTFAASQTYNFEIGESLVGDDTLSAMTTVSFSTGGTLSAESNAILVASAINAAGFVNVVAEIDSQNRVVISHEKGGDIHFNDGTGTPLVDLGFTPYVSSTGAGMLNLYDDLDGDHDFVASLWEPLVYVANEDPPSTLTETGQLWYSSVVEEVDIMIHNGNTWIGYLDYDHGSGVGLTDVGGPFVSASAPETQRDGTQLETGDLWISTEDRENYPTIYKYNKDLLKWILVDKTDQSTEDGVLFADARYNTSGINSDIPGAIEDLLVSDYLDPDAPDPALYPKGMLLWNLRRSGWNVKEFRQRYIDVSADNVRFGDEAMTDYYPHRWVTVSSNQDDGSGTFGRKAQRKVVVKALQALVNSNQQIRDEEGRVFNIMACPGYPELIGEMINLNFDRGLTAFIVGDTPARLTPDATSLLRWGLNERLAVEDNDIGAASFDEYMGMFYPWGFSSDNFGNNVVVPPSHMILRVIAINDQVAYPWFAPAGLRRGGVTNATAVGYVDSQEGEFKVTALNNGQRDTLYEAKINPITFFTGSGLVNYGQKTRAKTASALDRINVARLVIYLRSQLTKLAKPYIFEPNDRITRDEVKAAVESLLVELVGLRALYDFLVVCDETNNTPARIDRNELWIDIAIEPVKAVEFIYIPLRIKNTGEISGLA